MLGRDWEGQRPGAEGGGLTLAADAAIVLARAATVVPGEGWPRHDDAALASLGSLVIVIVRLTGRPTGVDATRLEVTIAGRARLPAGPDVPSTVPSLSSMYVPSEDWSLHPMFTLSLIRPAAIR